MEDGESKRSTLPTDHGPFRFLDLPRGLRNEIYPYVLCFKTEVRLRQWPKYERPELALLRCSEQIYSEAAEVFSLENTFLRVFTNITPFLTSKSPCVVPFLNIGDAEQDFVEYHDGFIVACEYIQPTQEAAKTFKYCSMSVPISSKPENRNKQVYPIVWESDAWCLFRILRFDPYVNGNLMSTIHLGLELHKHFGKTLCHARMRTLQEPFRKELQRQHPTILLCLT